MAISFYAVSSDWLIQTQTLGITSVMCVLSLPLTKVTFHNLRDFLAVAVDAHYTAQGLPAFGTVEKCRNA